MVSLSLEQMMRWPSIIYHPSYLPYEWLWRRRDEIDKAEDNQTTSSNSDRDSNWGWRGTLILMAVTVGGGLIIWHLLRPRCLLDSTIGKPSSPSVSSLSSSPPQTSESSTIYTSIASSTPPPPHPRECEEVAFSTFYQFLCHDALRSATVDAHGTRLTFVDNTGRCFHTVLLPGCRRHTIRKMLESKNLCYLSGVTSNIQAATAITSPSITSLLLDVLSLIVSAFGLVYLLGDRFGWNKGIFSWLFNRCDFFKMTNRTAETSGKKIKFNDVAGHESIKDELRQIVSFFKGTNSEISDFILFDAKPPSGILLHGPTGTGKTLLGKALADECGVEFIYACASNFVEIYAGQGALRVRNIFKCAERNKPCVLFIDEVDGIGGKRVGVSEDEGFISSGTYGCIEYDQTLNQLLVELDNVNQCNASNFAAHKNKMNYDACFQHSKDDYSDCSSICDQNDLNSANELKYNEYENRGKVHKLLEPRNSFIHSTEGHKHGESYNGKSKKTFMSFSSNGYRKSDYGFQFIIVIAATNRIGILDKALIRPGRFDKLLYVGLPNFQERIEAINLYCKDKVLGKGVDKMKIAEETDGFTYAEIENLINESVLLALRKKKKRVLQEHFMEVNMKIKERMHKRPYGSESSNYCGSNNKILEKKIYGDLAELNKLFSFVSNNST